MLDNEINAIKDKFIKELSPRRIYLFGSYASGTYNKDSDFDFYIIVDDNVDNIADLTALAYKSIRKIKQRPVDIVIGTNSRFEKRKEIPSVENEVYSKGVLLYGE